MDEGTFHRTPEERERKRETERGHGNVASSELPCSSGGNYIVLLDPTNANAMYSRTLILDNSLSPPFCVRVKHIIYLHNEILIIFN